MWGCDWLIFVVFLPISLLQAHTLSSCDVHVNSIDIRTLTLCGGTLTLYKESLLDGKFGATRMHLKCMRSISTSIDPSLTLIHIVSILSYDSIATYSMAMIPLEFCYRYSADNLRHLHNRCYGVISLATDLFVPVPSCVCKRALSSSFRAT